MLLFPRIVSGLVARAPTVGFDTSIIWRSPIGLMGSGIGIVVVVEVVVVEVVVVGVVVVGVLVGGVVMVELGALGVGSFGAAVVVAPVVATTTFSAAEEASLQALAAKTRAVAMRASLDGDMFGDPFVAAGVAAGDRYDSVSG